VGPQRRQDLDHQRRHRRRPRRRRRGRPGLKARGQASFVVGPEFKGKGLSQGQKFKKHGIRASHTSEVILDDLRPARQRAARREGQARRAAGPRPRARRGAGPRREARAHPRQGRPGRHGDLRGVPPAVGAQAVGIARAAYEYALEYAKTREQFGRPIVENQGIAFMLADMKTKLDASRLLVWRAAWMGKNNIPFTAGEGSMSKLFAGETASR
jgi:alkylation response protein AidB-like acyl-CoA dehydrogenase